MKQASLLAAVLLSCSFACAHAADSGTAFAKGGWSAQFGYVGNNGRLTANYETPSLWTFRIGSTHMDLTGELGMSYWWAEHDPKPGYASNMWQLNAIPMFRWWATDRIYLEAGVGAMLVSEHRFSQKDISSTFLFGDHVGVGYRIDNASRIGLRFSHFSNAGLKEPNQGLNQVQLTYAHSF
jgi:lipid A 3-O-deacylase